MCTNFNSIAYLLLNSVPCKGCAQNGVSNFMELKYPLESLPWKAARSDRALHTVEVPWLLGARGELFLTLSRRKWTSKVSGNWNYLNQIALSHHPHQVHKRCFANRSLSTFSCAIQPWRSYLNYSCGHRRTSSIWSRMRPCIQLLGKMKLNQKCKYRGLNWY